MLINKYAENKICDRGEYFQSSTIRVVLLIYQFVSIRESHVEIGTRFSLTPTYFICYPF